MKIKGNYDTEAEKELIALRAEAVVLIVIGGVKGNGFSVAGIEKRPADSVVPKLPAILRHMAGSIEVDIKQRGLQ